MEEKDLNFENSSNEENNDLSKIENEDSLDSSIFGDEQVIEDEIINESANEVQQNAVSEQNVADEIDSSLIEDFEENKNESIEEKLEEELQEELSVFENQEITEEIKQENIEEDAVLDFQEEEKLEEISEATNTEIKKTEEKNIEIAPILSDTDEFEEPVKELITVRPVKFQQFEECEPNRAIKKNLDILQDISMHVSVELGRTKTSIREVMEMETGSIVELDKIAGEQVEIFVNEKLVARGEVIVIEDKFGVRITSTSIENPNQNY